MCCVRVAVLLFQVWASLISTYGRKTGRKGGGGKERKLVGGPRCSVKRESENLLMGHGAG